MQRWTQDNRDASMFLLKEMETRATNLNTAYMPICSSLIMYIACMRVVCVCVFQ